MKLPICYFCARTKVLCLKDLKRLEKGEISQLDVDISNELVLLKEKKYSSLDNLTFVRAHKSDNLLVLMVRNSDKLNRNILIKVSRDLERKGYGRVRFVEESAEPRKIVEQIVSPSRVLGVDILWLPDGSSQFTVRIPHRDARRMPVKKEVAEDILTKLLGKYVRIVFL